VSLSLVSGRAKIKDNEITLTGAAPVVIRATQAGDSCYNPTETFDLLSLQKGGKRSILKQSPER
jgi:hypothetical protein